MQGDRKTYEKAHEPGKGMAIPLIILAVASILLGYIMKDQIMGPGTPYIDYIGAEGHHSIESEFIPTWVK